MNTPNQTLAEKYRPRKWPEVIAQNKVVAIIHDLINRGSIMGEAYLLSGASGTGKTTIARLLAAEVTTEPSLDVLELPAEAIDVKRLVTWYNLSHSYGFKIGRAFIINRVDALRSEIVGRLLDILEDIPSHVIWVFTTTVNTESKSKAKGGKPPTQLFHDPDADAQFISRCTLLPLSRQHLKAPFAKRVKEIAMIEGLDGQPIEWYAKLAEDKNNNMRAMLKAVNLGKMKQT